MGPYLAKPETTIHTSHDENDRFIYCTSEMQGWRKTQEDAHTALLKYDDRGSAFFAVFDGHGGEEVSKYCALYLPSFIKRSSLFNEETMLESLKNSFLEFDRSLKEPDVLKELRKLASLDELEDIEEEETVILKQEAQMPLELVIQKSILPDVPKDTKNGESSKDVKNETDEATVDTKAEPESDEKKDKNGEVNDNSNHVDKEEPKVEANSNNKNEVAKPKDTEEEEDISKPGSSGTSKLPKMSIQAKSIALKALNQQIYEAFLNDYGSDDDDEEDDEENEEFEESDNDESEEEENDDDDELDDSEDDEDTPPQAMDSNFYITPGGGSGCTAIVALVYNNKLYVANVGDSRCVLSRDGKAIELSEDHKPEDEKERNRIVKAGGEVTPDGRVNGGLNLSRAIGDHLYKKNDKLSDEEQMVTALPDIQTHDIDFDKDQFLFLACDGIWNSMSSQEVVDFINERMQKDVELKDICEELFKACLAPNTDGDGSGCDNMTCILVKFKKGSQLKRSLEDSDNHSEPAQKIMKTIDDDVDLCKPGSSKS